MIRAGVAFFVAAASALASSASTARSASPHEPRAMALEFAQCIVDHHPTRAAEIVVNELHNREILKRYASLIDSECGSEIDGLDMLALSMREPALQYALSNALVRSDPNIAVVDVANVGPLTHWSLPDMMERASQEIRFGKKEKQLAEAQTRAVSVIAVDYFGECVVRAEPALAGELVRADIGSAAESSAFEKLRPTYASCVPAGRQVSFDREALRGAIALNYYRIAMARRVPTAAVAKP